MPLSPRASPTPRRMRSYPRVRRQCPGTGDPARHSLRDRHVRFMAEKGRIGWQRTTGYGRRSLGATAIGRHKHLIGSRLRARIAAGQRGELALAVTALNRMIRVVKPVFVRGA